MRCFNQIINQNALNYKPERFKLQTRMLTKFIKHNFAISASDKILFFGSGKVAYPSALKLHQNYPNLHFVTHFTPEKQKFKNQVEIFCIEKSIPFSTPIKSKGDKAKVKQQWTQFIEQLNEPDFGVVCSFGYMIPQRVISKFKKGMIVIHPSLLPKYRGGAPIFHAIANGQDFSGTSYIEISPGKFDSGNLLFQKSYPLSKSAKYDQVETELASFCAQNLLQVLNNIDSLRPGIPQSELTLPENEQYKLKAPIIKQKHLDLNNPAEKVYNLSRALGNPRIRFEDKELIVSFESKYQEDSQNYEVGRLKVNGKKLYVKCKDKFIKLQSWKQPSKKQTPCGIFIAAYLRGREEKDWPYFT